MRMTIGVFILMAATAFAHDSGRKDSYVLRDGDVTWMLGEGMSSDSLKKMQSTLGREFLWARRNGQTFVSRDADVIDQARAAVQQNVGRDAQEARFAEITDAAMHRAARRRGSYILTSTINRALISGGMTIANVVNLRNKYNKQFLWVRNAGGTWLIEDPDWIDRATAFFADEIALGPEHKAVAEEARKLDHEEERLDKLRDAGKDVSMEELNRRQEEVGRREKELDERQEALEKIAEGKLWALIDDAIRRGVARRLR